MADRSPISRALTGAAVAALIAAAVATAGVRAASVGLRGGPGTLVAFSSWWPATARDVATLGGTTSVICAVDARGRTYRLTSPSPGDQQVQAEWSPDGLQIAVVNGPVTGPDLPNVVYWRLGHDTRYAEPGPAESEWPSWGPVGNVVAYQHPPDGAASPQTPAAIWVANLDGSGARALGDGRGRAAWSPDGTQLAIRGETGIRIVGADGTSVRTLLSSVHVPWVDWSRDGRLLVLQKGLNTGGPLVLIAPNGTSAHALGQGAAGYTPVWSPNSDWIAYQTTNTIRAVARSDSATRTLYTGVLVDDAGLSWQPRPHPDLLKALPPCVIVGSRTRRRLVGSRFADVIIAGSGPSSVSAGAGNDMINTRNGRRDVVACGSGRDTVYADQLDRVDKDCEQVLRARVRRDP